MSAELERLWATGSLLRILSYWADHPSNSTGSIWDDSPRDVGRNCPGDDRASEPAARSEGAIVEMIPEVLL